MRKTATDRDAFIAAYDKYTTMYKDPVEVMFEIMSDEDAVDLGVRRAAASDLLSYRFPKTKAIELNVQSDQAHFHFAMVPFGQSPQQIAHNDPNQLLAKDEFTSVDQEPDTLIPVIIDDETVYEVHEG